MRDRFRRLHIEPLENRRLLTSLSGFVYNDVNGDGVMETGGAGIRNAAITLTGTDDILGGVTMTALTSSSGAYSFNLGSGNYKLTVHDPAGYVGGVAVVGSQNIGFTGYDTYSLANDLYIDQIMLEPGADGTDNNFGELSAAVVSGTVWNDSANNDGVKQAGEPVLSGVTVQLSGSDDRANDVETSAKTNAQGAYAFASLRPGTYKLTVGQPTGYIPGKVIAGSEPTVVASPPTLVGGQGQIQFSVDPGNIGTGNNFAELRPASLSGYVWDDTANNNGVKQTGEPGIAGVKLTLTGISDLGAITSVSAVTDTSGAYCFTNLRPGTYTLTETQPPGYTDGKEGIGTPGGTIGIGQFTNIVLAAGVSGANNNFGEIKSAIASQLVITMQPSPTAKAGTAFAVQPVIIEEDQYGNVISGDSEHTVTVTLGSLGTASVRGTTTVTFVNGVAAFSGLSYNKAETMNLT
ncbi:MAG: SdrD B-like domain-containing protein, partial [Planctomycetota bacterium]